ncbi:type II toxin-antitoxin system YafQ family toxin [candidate division KSB1 bacterium]|nr:type II toxin-antitoxin system YafQ family toxin [candidate division KSB1 bacterium]
MRIIYTNQFKRDYKRVQNQNKDVEKLKLVIDRLAGKKKLDPRYRDHPLSGNWKGFRDCHIESDWVLIYKATEDALVLERTGSHSELFKQ